MVQKRIGPAHPDWKNTEAQKIHEKRMADLQKELENGQAILRSFENNLFRNDDVKFKTFLIPVQTEKEKIEHFNYVITKTEGFTFGFNIERIRASIDSMNRDTELHKIIHLLEHVIKQSKRQLQRYYLENDNVKTDTHKLLIQQLDLELKHYRKLEKQKAATMTEEKKYGKYKINCQQCGKEFWTDRKAVKYCIDNKSCRNAAKKQNQRSNKLNREYGYRKSYKITK